MPRTGVQFINNDEPSFISQFKQRVGHKNEADVDTKRQIPNFDDDDGSGDEREREDEKPVVVVVKKGDLTADEVEKEVKEKDEGPADLDQKITFKKPTKRSKQEEHKDKGGDGGGGAGEPVTKTKKKSSKKLLKKKNTSLLSFGDNDEEDE